MVGEKKAREMLFLCRQYTATQAMAMGLVNEVVPMSALYSTTRQWCRDMHERGPEAIRIA